MNGTKVINLVKPFDVECPDLSWTSQDFEFFIRGETTGGKRLDVRMKFPHYFAEFLAEKLHKVIAQQQRRAQANLDALKGQ